jgi:hypothetical protein
MDSTNRMIEFPHSDISGSMLASSSPERFVGRYVLLRLCVPRYPPLALVSLTWSEILRLQATEPPLT